MGRPTKLTPELAAQITKYVRAGAYIETAAAACGLSKDTFYEWLKRGNKEKTGPFAEFTDAINKAMAASEIGDLVRIGVASKKSWQAAAWRLERRFPQKYALGRRLPGDDEDDERGFTFNYNLDDDDQDDAAAPDAGDNDAE